MNEPRGRWPLWSRLTAPRPTATSENVRRALADYARDTLGHVVRVRTVVLTVLILWLVLNYGLAVTAEHLPVMLAFIAIGLAARALSGYPRLIPWLPFLVALLDVALLSYTLFAPGRTYPDAWPWPTVLRQPSFVYYFVFMALTTIWFSPALVLWSGALIAMALALVGWLILRAPGTITGLPGPGSGADEQAWLARYLDPHYVHADDIVVRSVVALVVAVILAYAAERARRLVYDQAENARQRANLARYVAPSVVERLARADRPFGDARRLPAAVLFADLRGFTTLAEPLTPEAALALLREFHARMAEIVFAHQGTLDKFIGDGLMATFGTPEPAADDASRAFAAARAMQDAIASWSRERLARGESPLGIGIGLHWGEVIQGDIGGGNRFEFAVIGDTVNVASRLERLTRRLGAVLCTSDTAIARLVAEGGSVPEGLRPVGDQALRGRRGRIVVWADRAWAEPR